MRLVEIAIPLGERELVIETLEARDIDYYITEETSGRGGREDYAAIITFPLPQNAVQPVIDELRDVGLSEEAHVIIIDAEVDVSTRFERLVERYTAKRGRRIRIAREEIRIHARELSPSLRTFVTMTIVSAVVATAGLLLDSPAVVVGSMVIAPLVGPALSASIGTVLDDRDLFRRGVRLQVLGVVLAVASAAAFATLVRFIPLFPPGTDVTRIPEVAIRISPDFLSLIIALGAGIAGIVSLSAGASTALVGVMIAVALIPPAATVGIGIAWGEPVVTVSAGILVLVNLLAINLSALLTLRYMGYRPKEWLKLQRSNWETAKRVSLLILVIVLLSAFLGGVTYSSIQDAQFERSVRTTTDALLELPQYSGGERLEVDVRYGPSVPLPRKYRDPAVPFHRPREVIVTVGKPTNERYPGLAERLRARLYRRTGRDVSVQIRYVSIDEAPRRGIERNWLTC
ncbi:TIGR00341 family protein [Haladaptatus sp. W1]|nr:TIGR00341 family protein [Haladaptatus sp. W1]ODR80506.1 TIGR00341 family protein [Haladaptatus sp. W1]